MAILDDLFDDAAHEIDRDRKSDAFSVLRQHCCVDPYQFTLRIYQCSAGTAEVDSGIGLYEAFEICESHVASGRADDSMRDGLLKSIRISNCQHDIANTQFLGAAQCHHGHLFDLDVQDREIGVRVDADDFGVGNAAIGEL